MSSRQITSKKNDTRLQKLDSALGLYDALLLPRLIEEKMLKLLRQNKISKWFSGIGQEAISVGVTKACYNEDFILPMHRNLGVFTSRNVPLYPLFCQLFGKADGFSSGRERSFHFGSLEHRIVGMISHLAAMMPVADGLALANKLRDNQSIAVSFCGDGATSEGDFHEALNLAAVWNLPVVFIIENNGYGLSTPTSQQYACEHLVDRAIGYGVKGIQVDGNDIFAVMNAMKEARASALKGKPVLIEAQTFRMRGHEEASGTAYVPKDMMAEWEKKDPIVRFEHHLRQKFDCTDQQFSNHTKLLKEFFKADLDKALNSKEPNFIEENERKAVFAPQYKPCLLPRATKKEKYIEKRFVDAISNALSQSLRVDEKVLLMGQDVAEYGGVFKISDGFLSEFGEQRIRNTPIIESGILGAALGLALDGFKPIVEMQFADFVSCGMNQIIQNIAKSHYRWTPGINVTIRLPHGAGVGAGPFHSQSPESWFMPHAGLKILVPSTVEDAQNMLYSAILEPNPVLFFEHKRLYRNLRETAPAKAEWTDIHAARLLREGNHMSIITFGWPVHWALDIAKEMEVQGISIEIVDLRSLAPIDWSTLLGSVKKTNRALLLQEAPEIMGPMSEIASYLSEHAFQWLDAPIKRVSSIHTPIPFNKNLEAGYLGKHLLKEHVLDLLNY
ncbi:MAG: dehydrogenase [Balneola sp.]|nr:dehydrogenase [Balneola sp.]